MRTAACLLMLMAGCGSQVGNLAAADALARCRAFGLSDAQIDSAFLVAQADRDRGITRSEEVLAAVAGCVGPQGDLVPGCTDCTLAIVDAAYQ